MTFYSSHKLNLVLPVAARPVAIIKQLQEALRILIYSQAEEKVV